MKRHAAVLLSACIIGGCSDVASDPANGDPGLTPDAGFQPDTVQVVRRFPALTFEQPIGAVAVPSDNAWWILEKGGTIRRVDESLPDLATTVADLSDRVESGSSEAGLLGLAFHPDFAQNGRVYVSYTAPGAPLTSVVARYTSSDGGRTLDPTSETIVLTLDQPYANHNGGHVLFGPDGMLYVGFGDGGSGGDPQGNAQNTGSLLGKILRLDVDGAAPYAIPPDNPFAVGGGRAEVWAFGLRNPWRFHFDRATGTLWAADVGQDAWEEIDIIEAGRNYGWNVREGAHCYNQSTCETAGLTDPVAEYGRDGGCSITGGYVYRGTTVPLAGAYLFGDFCSGNLWALARTADGGYQSHLIADTALNIASFAENDHGELLIVDMQGTLHGLTTSTAEQNSAISR